MDQRPPLGLGLVLGFQVGVRPAGFKGFTEQQLAALVTRDNMIGVSLPA